MSFLKKGISLISQALSLILILPIRAYQLTISPLLGPRCKFHPSCSHYAIGSLKVHGPLKGMVLTVVRLGRCHPWQLGGLDPVPPPHAWRPEIYPDGRPRNDAPATGTEVFDKAGV